MNATYGTGSSKSKSVELLQNSSGKRHSSWGQTLIEVLIVVGVGSLVLAAITATSVITVSNNQFSKNKSLALKFLQQGIELVRLSRNTASSWDEFLAASWPNESLEGNFTRTTTLTQLTDDEVEVAVTVSWSDSKGDHQVASVTRLSDWR